MATFRSTFYEGANIARDFSDPNDTTPHGRSATGLTEMTTAVSAANVQSGGGDFTASGAGYVECYVDGAVWVAIGAAPTAAVGTDFYVPSSERRVFSVESGDKISVIDDS